MSSFVFIRRWILMRAGGFVMTRLTARRDPNAIPAVDRDNAQRQVDDLLLAELAARDVVHSIGHVVFPSLCERFSPLNRCALAIGVVRTFAPGIESVQPLLGLAQRAQVLPVHVDAIR